MDKHKNIVSCIQIFPHARTQTNKRDYPMIMIRFKPLPSSAHMSGS